MTLKENNLALACRQAEDAAGRLVHWVQSNPDRVGLSGPSLVRELEARRTAAKLLARSASRPPAIGVAGPSGAGKSLVVGGLARPQSGRITVQFAGLPYGVDYLAYIEPGESSLGLGVATRLSPRPRSTPPGFPIPVRLLSVADIARILATVHFGEAATGSGDLPDREAMRRLCRRAREETAPYPIPGLTTRDVMELREYLESYFGDDAIVRALAATEYWDVLAQSAPRLTDAMRAELLEQLWPGLPEATGLFGELVDALGRLGHSSEAFIPLEAIVDVDAVRGAVARARTSLLDAACQLQAPAAGDLVVVHGQKGHKPAIPRAALAGIVAEVRFTLATPPGAGLAEAEIIEFPGLCAPAEHEPTAEAGASGLRRLYTKCKSLYQLQRNAHERELTSLVVCADEGPSDLGRFPEVLAEWVELVHGATPVERETVDAGLFIALVETSAATAERASQAGAGSADWPARLNLALFDSLDVLSDWPREWTPGRAFDNVFLVREPLSRIDATRLLAPGTAGAASPFDAARPGEGPGGLVLNQEDGGLSYLTHSVAGVTNIFSRHRQISQALARMRAACAERLRRFSAAEEIFLHRETRHRSALIAVARLKRAAEAGRFGHVVRALQVPASELAGVLDDINRGPAAAAPEGAREAAPARADLVPATAAAADGADGADPALRAGRAMRYADAAVAYWIGSMRAAAGNPRLAWQIGVPGPVLASIADELTDAADRLGLVETIARALGRVVIRDLEPGAEAVAASVPAADAIASFVKWLGYQTVAGDRRPRRRDKARTPIFPPRQPSPAALDGDPTDGGDRYHLDWCQGYLAVVEDNVAALFDKRARGEAERTLGDVLRNLDTNSAEAQP